MKSTFQKTLIVSKKVSQSQEGQSHETMTTHFPHKTFTTQTTKHQQNMTSDTSGKESTFTTKFR